MTTEEKLDDLADDYNQLCQSYESSIRRMQKDEAETNKRAIQYYRNQQETEAKAECVRIIGIRRNIKVLSEDLNDARERRDEIRRHALDSERTRLYLDASKLMTTDARTTKLTEVEKATEKLATARAKYDKSREKQLKSNTVDITDEDTKKQVADVFASVKLMAEASMGMETGVRLANMQPFSQDKEVEALHKRIEALQKT